MKKTVFLFAFLGAFNIFAFSAEDDWRTLFEKYLRNFKYKASGKMTSNVKITAVAAVRGAKAKNNPWELYWKGSESEKAKEKINSEKKILQEAIEIALSGDIGKAKKQLEDFINKNPDSYFINEAKEMLEKLPKEENDRSNKTSLPEKLEDR